MKPKPGHIVELWDDEDFDCAFCGAPATWDKPTQTGRWAYMCDEHEAVFAMYPGKTGLGIGQRLIRKETA